MLAQKIELRAAVHAPLDQFETVDLSLDGAVAPGLDDGRAYGSLVLPEPGDEAAEIGRGCSLQPPGDAACRGIRANGGRGNAPCLRRATQRRTMS